MRDTEVQLGRWWRTPSAKAAMRRAEKAKREKFKQLRKLTRKKTNERKQRERTTA